VFTRNTMMLLAAVMSFACDAGSPAEDGYAEDVGYPCQDDQECQAGHPCEFADTESSGAGEFELGTCSLFCFDELCTGEKEECSTVAQPYGECIYVTCGRTVACPVGEYCDVSLHRCHGLDGSCSSNADCPNFGGVVDVECDTEEGLCAVNNSGNSSLPGNDLEPDIEIMEPDEGELVASVDELEFRWTSDEAKGPFFVYVFDGRPSSVFEVSEYAIWGAATAATATSVSWSEGKAIEAGEWSGGPGVVPEGEALHVIVIGYEKGTAVSTSDLRAFFVGSGGWAVAGESCSDLEGVSVPGDCVNPSQALGCVNGTCRTMCASDLDCYLSGLSCGSPDSQTGLRHCI
jgi:hypothetical protein